VAVSLVDIIHEILSDFQTEALKLQLKEIQRLVFADFKLFETFIILATSQDASASDLKLAGRAFACMPITMLLILDVPLNGGNGSLSIENYMRALAIVLQRSDAQVFALYAFYNLLKDLSGKPQNALGPVTDCLTRSQILGEVLQLPLKSKNSDIIRISLNIIVLIVNNQALHLF